MRRALAEYEVRGIKTTIPFFQWVLDDEDFVAARFDTGFIDRKLGARNGRAAARAGRRSMQELAAIAAALAHGLSPAAPTTAHRVRATASRLALRRSVSRGRRDALRPDRTAQLDAIRTST